MTRLPLALLCLMFMVIAMKSQDYLPKSCKVGDVTDSYDGRWKMCVKANTWTDYRSAYGMNGDFNFPNCRLAFKDAQGGLHCPYETATGRVVACEPCRNYPPYIPDRTQSTKSDDAKYCAKWYSSCERLVTISKSEETCEPTWVSFGDVRKDKTKTGEYECPDGYRINWFGHDGSSAGTAPICVKSKAKDRL